VRSRRAGYASGRPLNFTVRSRFGKPKLSEEWRYPASFSSSRIEPGAGSHCSRGLRSAESGARAAALPALDIWARANAGLVSPLCESCPGAVFVRRRARFTWTLCRLWLQQHRRTRTVVICEGDF
jgi:hypothetical protein